jgi:iron complex transport system permease protein
MSRRALGLLVAVVAFPAVAGIVGMLPGPSGLSPGEVVGALLGRPGDAVARDVVLLDRLPRVGLGLLVGAALALAGPMFQALLRNPLADPYLVGVGPGALLGASVAGVLGVSAETVLGISGSGACAFGGAVLAAVLVLGVTGGGGRAASGRLLLAGIAVGTFVTAVATWILYVENRNWEESVRWLLGSLAWADGPRLAAAGAGTALLAGFALWHARDLDALALGEDSARLGGLDVARSVRTLAAGACLLTALAVAVAGLVGFVGLVVPHIGRRLVGPGHRALLPVAAGLGAGLLVLADALARATVRVEVPVGVVTALLGAPLLALLVRRGGA